MGPYVQFNSSTNLQGICTTGLPGAIQEGAEFMLVLRIWNYIRGYVIILVEGFFPEKFINVCINRGIFLWDINRQNSRSVTLKVGVRAFKKLRPAARKTRCRLSVRAKKGLPFLLRKYRKRKTFAVGCLIFVGMVYLLSSFIWTVEVYGNEKVPTQEIVESLSESGLKAGVWKPVINTETITNRMMISMQELAWISIDISGTRAIVEVAERVKQPRIIEKDVPCNIVAAKDGIVDSIYVKEGTPIVDEGSTVKKGDLLVAGMVESKYGVVRYVHAMADITARTWYEESAAALFSRTKIIDTGNTKNKYSVKLFNKVIGLGDTKPPFANFNIEQDIRYLSLGWDVRFPFGLVTHKYTEKKHVKEKISSGKAKEEAANTAWEKLKQRIPQKARVTDKKIYIEPLKDGVKARILVECIEEIGLQERISY